ncbi:MAG: hypothetical protein HDS79_05765 [Bacteroidales bacterium]|nr:hypothetical protein [Bacteroidales bacterium]
MKKMLLMAGLLVCSLAAFATESAQYGDSKLLAQGYSYEQVVRAYYVNGGRLEMLKIKIAGGKVVQYAVGKYNGRDDWRSAGNSDILRTNYQYDGELAREFENKAYIQISVGNILTIYF